jgi:hypothetical protein
VLTLPALDKDDEIDQADARKALSLTKATPSATPGHALPNTSTTAR